MKLKPILSIVAALALFGACLDSTRILKGKTIGSPGAVSLVMVYILVGNTTSAIFLSAFHEVLREE